MCLTCLPAHTRTRRTTTQAAAFLGRAAAGRVAGLRQTPRDTSSASGVLHGGASTEGLYFVSMGFAAEESVSTSIEFLPAKHDSRRKGDHAQFLKHLNEYHRAPSLQDCASTDCALPQQ